MSVLDKMVAAVTPIESDAERSEARAKVRDLAARHGWLAAVLRDHEEIESAFAEVARAADPATRRLAQMRLGTVLTGHAIAEESVLYPALVQAGRKSAAESAYKEQAEAKVHMAELERIAPMTDEFLEKLEAIRKAVAHHVYEEEGTWFVELAAKLSVPDQDRLEERYESEFERYTGTDGPGADLEPEFADSPAVRRRTKQGSR